MPPAGPLCPGARAILHLLMYLIVSGVGLPRAFGQEVIGQRLFSDQLVIAEPFVEDELSMPSLLHIRKPAGGGERRSTITEIGAELKKRITSNLEVSVSGGLELLSVDHASLRSGFENLGLGLKYQCYPRP